MNLRILLACLMVGTTSFGPMALAQPAAKPGARCAEIPLADAKASAVQTPSAPNAWGGPRTGNEPTLSDRVVDYRISAKLDPVKHTVEGEQQLTWRNRSNQPVCAVYLHLYLNAFSGSGSTFMTEQSRGFSFRSGVDTKDGEWGYIQLRSVTQGGQPVKWTFVQPDGGPATDRTVVRLDLPQAVAPGDSTTFDMRFFDQLPRVIARTGYFDSFHMVAQWFPKIAVLELPGERGATTPRWNAHEFHMHSEFYADFGHYDVSITVPKGYTVGATGELQGTPSESNGWVTHRYVQGDVHDFAWTADKRSGKPLEATWNHPGSPPVKVRVLYPQEFADNAPVVLKATLDSLTWFSKTLGPYPYRTVTAIIPPHNAGEAGGMEYPTLFTASSTLNFKPGGIEQYMLDFVTIHEFGHGYFYGILASNEFEEPALDEGVNQYWDNRMLEARKQDIVMMPAALARRLGWAPSLSVFDAERSLAQLRNAVDPLGGNSWNRASSDSYTSVYMRTSTMLKGLERQVGQAAMDRAMKLYYERWKFRHPSFADFREALAEGTGQREVVERNFAQAVYGSQMVNDYIGEFESVVDAAPRGYVDPAADKPVLAKRGKLDDKRPLLYRTTVIVRRDGADVPQTLRVTFRDGSTRNVQFSGEQAWFRYQFETASKATKVELDPDRHYTTDVNLLDNARTLESDGRAADAVASRLLAWLQTALTWMVSA